jgi:hypothetical protein
MAGHKDRCGWAWLGRAGHPASLPKGYHTAARGQSHMTHAPVASRAAPGPPRDRAAPGRRDAPRAPTCKICEPAAPLRSLAVKHLTRNQVLGDRIYGRLEPADENPLVYISCYINGYGRP